MCSSITQALSEWVAGLHWEEVPPAVQEAVKVEVVDAVGDALAGHDMEETRQVLRFVEKATGNGSSTVLGGGTSSPLGATFANGYLITAATICDVYRPTHCHVSPEVLPPALATAELMGRSGTDFLVAVAAGLEVTTRVGQALGPVELRARGWHAPGVTGGFGGAAAAGKLLGLSATEQARAFGLAGSQASGTYAQWETPGVKFHQAHGAASGLVSAMLVSEGFEATGDIFTAPDGGFLNAYTGGGNGPALLDELGARWELAEIALRLWPTGSPVQSIPTGLLELMHRHNIASGTITAIRLTLPPMVYNMHQTVEWRDPFSARLSPQYIAAVIALDGACWFEQFGSSRIGQADVNEFARHHVTITSDARLPEAGANIVITLSGGEEYEILVSVPKGDPTVPLTLPEVRDKFYQCAQYRLTPATIDEVFNRLAELETAGDMATLIGKFRANLPLRGV